MYKSKKIPYKLPMKCDPFLCVFYTGISGINYEPPFPGEEIDYNERYYWADPWSQGRLGFGRFAGRYNQEFRAAQFRGAPYPILWIAEYFTLDGELIRWGRKFRLAGWYGHILLW